MIRSDIPLTELHRHLEGSLRAETMISIARQYGCRLPAWTAEELTPYMQIDKDKPVFDVSTVDPKFRMAQELMVNYEACKDITRACLEDAVREGIDYLELRFSPLFMAEAHNLDPMKITESVCEVWEETKETLPITWNLIAILSRHYGPDACMAELEAAIAYKGRGIVAMDLAGDELNYAGELFLKHYHRARDAGLNLIAHAGEFTGAQSIRQAITELGAQRIGHGIRAVDDPEVMEMLGTNHIAIESCPTSNIQILLAPSYFDHPIKRFLREGLLVTLNTDNPALSGINIGHEYQMAFEKIQFTKAELHQLQENGLSAAFISEEEKERIRSKKTVSEAQNFIENSVRR